VNDGGKNKVFKMAAHFVHHLIAKKVAKKKKKELLHSFRLRIKK
jgi:hypothetical protein